MHSARNRLDRLSRWMIYGAAVIAAAYLLYRMNAFPWPGVLLLPVVPMAVHGWRRARQENLRERRRQAQKCEHCGYDLRGNESGICPECGMPAVPVWLRFRRQRRAEEAREEREAGDADATVPPVDGPEPV